MADSSSKILAWGACKVTVTPIADSGASISAAVTFTDVVEDSAQLTATQGDKNEAKIEGGAVEAVRYNANTYQFVMSERLHSGKKTPTMSGTDGVIAGEFTVKIESTENTTAPTVTINRASANVQLSYTADGGIIAAYTFDSLKPSTGEQITVA